MNYLDIIANEELLTKMTQQEHEWLTYAQKCERLKNMMQVKRAPAPYEPIPF